jgi:hypothetical protein
MTNMEELRERVVDVLDERLSEVAWLPFVHRGDEFRFMRAVTVVFDTGIVLEQPDDLLKHLPNLTFSSIYYHFIEARRRTDYAQDDFSAWLAGFGDGTEDIVKRLESVDFYYLTLPALQKQLITALEEVMA